jgi:hypothetical protein
LEDKHLSGKPSYAVLLSSPTVLVKISDADPIRLAARFTIDRTVLDVYVIPPIAATPAVL